MGRSIIEVAELKKFTGSNSKFIITSKFEVVKTMLSTVFNVSEGNTVYKWDAWCTMIEFLPSRPKPKPDQWVVYNADADLEIHALNPARTEETLKHFRNVSAKKLHREPHCRIFSIEEIQEYMLNFRGISLAGKTGIL